MVEQLGLAIILSSAFNSEALISGTINLWPGFILQAEELSITMVPTAANLGAQAKEHSPPAENNAISGFNAIASSRDCTTYSFPSTLNLPASLTACSVFKSVKSLYFITSARINPFSKSV